MIKQLDLFFEGKSKKDVLYIHLAAVLFIGFIIFYFVYPVAASYQAEQEKKHKNNVNNLSNLNMQKNSYLGQIVNLTKTKKRLQLSKKSLYKEMVFFNDLVSLLDFAKFDKYKWAYYMKDIVYNAKDEGLDLIKFDNTLYNERNGTINRKMDITVNGRGKFKNFISYIYKYENTKQLIRINGLEASDKGEYMIKFTLYGYDK